MAQRWLPVNRDEVGTSAQTRPRATSLPWAFLRRALPPAERAQDVLVLPGNVFGGVWTVLSFLPAAGASATVAAARFVKVAGRACTNPGCWGWRA